jgi:glycine cleavage system transcriptional repressor
MTHAILSAIGTDRPGLVDEVSQFIFDRGGNIEDSRSVNLRGQFAMVLLVGAPAAENLERLRADLPGFAERTGLHAELRPSAAVPPHRGEATLAAVPYRLTGTGIDQPGLVHRVARVLRELNVNIESLDTRLTAAPYTGSPVFEMELVVSVPRTTPVAQLRHRLGIVCDELNVDWELAPL